MPKLLTPLLAIIGVVIAAEVLDHSFNAYIQLVFLYICIILLRIVWHVG